MKHIKHKLWQVMHRLDQENIPLLQLLPQSYKKELVRRVLGKSPTLEYKPEDITLDGTSLQLYLTYISRMRLLKGNDLVYNYLKTHLKPGMCFVDVGANQGLYSLLGAKNVGPEGHVHAVEPAHDNLSLLQENIKRNSISNITISPCAAGIASSEMTFYVRGEYSGGNSLYAASNTLDHEQSTSSISSTYQVAVRRLDELVRDPVDLVKVDVEGGELEVLAGMTRILAENPKLCMVLEWNPVLQERTGHGPTQLPETLLAHGFTLNIISPFTAPLRSTADIRNIVPKVIEQGAHMVDIAAVRG